MKTLLITTALLMTAAIPGFAEGTSTLMGCEIVQVEGHGYWIKVDPTCVFTVDEPDHGDRIKEL